MTNNSEMEDVQGSADSRLIAIDKVGIKDIRHPVRIKTRANNIQHTVATFSMSVFLPQHFKGTHMSRFVAILNHYEDEISLDSFKAMLTETVEKLESAEAHIEMCFPYFMQKTAPASGVKSLMDYEVCLIGHIRNNKPALAIKIIVPVTSLCPCSKSISDRGAHNQRSHVTITVHSDDFIWLEDLIEMVEQEASCELYSLLKRTDEKVITERAYDNPKFVEDAVRDVGARLNQDKRINAYTVEVENFESIHNHSAYAMITRDKRQ